MISRDDTRLLEFHSHPAEPRPIESEQTTISEARTERIAAWVLGMPSTLALSALCGFQLATWIPHYLTWPWFADHDVFATMALGWSQGQLPYRDLAGNNFPGTIYIFWLLGTLFGWGRTIPFLALDAALVLLLGTALSTWSVRRFGRILPGLAGFAVFLTYYLGLDFSRVGQRDWHGPLFVVLGLLALESIPGRWSRPLAALATALALSIRPQTILFLPALLLAVVQTARDARATRDSSDPTASNGSHLRIVVGFLAWLSLFTVLAFAPILIAGIGRDFFHGIGRVMYGASYNKAGGRSILQQFLLQATHLEFVVVPLLMVLVMPWADRPGRRSALVWLVALAGAWLYKPISPVPFPYLEHPLRLIIAVNAAVLVQLLLTPGLTRPVPRLVAILLALTAVVEIKPAQCSVSYTRQGIQSLRTRTEPIDAPLGLRIGPPGSPQPLAYPWKDYRGTIEFLRTETSSATLVANLVHVVPALNSPAGRQTFLPAESLAWLKVDPGAEAGFQSALETPPAGSLVVWTPDIEPAGDLFQHDAVVQRLAPVIRKNFEPLARFGDVEVWKRR